MWEGDFLAQGAWETLTIQDNFIFCRVMETYPDICKRFSYDTSTLAVSLFLDILLSGKKNLPPYAHSMEEDLFFDFL